MTVDTRGPDEVGRRARLELVFAERNGRTVLAHGYAEPPLRIGRSFDTGDGLQLILASSAPGIFGGDVIEQVIRVEPGARVRLTSQSALQVHPSPASHPARLTSHFDIREGARLECWWDPLIPFARASLDQRFDITVEQGGCLAWSDACMSGREGRGERWAFTRLTHELRLRHAAAVVYLERYAVDPGSSAPMCRWVGADACYFGTTFRIGFGEEAGRAEALHQALDDEPDVSGAADLLTPDDLLLVRLAAASGVAFHRARGTVATILGMNAQKR